MGFDRSWVAHRGASRDAAVHPASCARAPTTFASTQGSQQHLAAVTHWVAADVCSRQGLRLVAAALQYRSSAGRLAVLVNAAGAATAGDGKEQRLAPVERLLVAVSSGLLQTGGRVSGMGGQAWRLSWPAVLPCVHQVCSSWTITAQY